MISKSVFIKKKRIMEQFSLEKYLANPSRKVVTRDGRKVRIICTDAKLAFCPIIALIEGDGGKSEYLINYKEDGVPVGFHEAYNILFFAPEKHIGWVNIYQVGKNKKCGFIYETEEAAKDQFESNEHIATVKIEWEE